MASDIFKAIFEELIVQFVGSYSEGSPSIFKNEYNRLIHPGEYGRYREEICKKLLRLVLEKGVSVSDGFVITSDNQISTQCDVIVYNSDVSPFLADGIAKMFPAEEVRMIGEIKSTLSKRSFIDALRKLAENKKKILNSRDGIGACKHGRRSEVYNTVASFLVCNKLDFDFDKLTYEEIYSGIERRYWHNSVLSVEDATLSYLLKFSDFSEMVRDKLRENQININTVSSWQYPFFSCENEWFPAIQNHVHIQEGDKFAHIKRFFIDLAICNKDLWVYSYDPVVYLGMEIKSMYMEMPKSPLNTEKPIHCPQKSDPQEED